MPQALQLSILRNGVAEWNAWRADHQNLEPDLSRAILIETELRGANLKNADLRDCVLIRADFTDATLIGANLSFANLQEANLSSVNLRDAVLFGTIFKNATLSGAHVWNAHISDANFMGADLSSADFTNATLIGTDFHNANLACANLSRANLRGTNFTCADLTGVDLSYTDFYDTKLPGAVLAYARVQNTSFANCDLGEAKGLDLMKHFGPSAIGIDTMYRSKGNIPEVFLRECGVPESFIMQMHSLVGALDGIQFYSCFISYSSADENFAKRLHGKMRDAHLRVWFAPEDVQGGKKLHEQIETAIRVYDKLLIVLSEASLQSEWVMTELRKARNAERRSAKRKLFPVRLVDFETLRNWECFDADSGKDLAVEVREYFIPDFSNWKNHDQFEAAFARLAKDLRADAYAT